MFEKQTHTIIEGLPWSFIPLWLFLLLTNLFFLNFCKDSKDNNEGPWIPNPHKFILSLVAASRLFLGGLIRNINYTIFFFKKDKLNILTSQKNL